MNKIFLQLSVFIILAIALTSCPEINNPSGGSDNIKFGEQIELPTKQISASGGTISFGDEAKELSGLKINVPPNSYETNKTFKVSIAKIQSHKFGERFKPITPLIKISNGGGYSEKIMTLEIPVQLEKGKIAAAFFYNDQTGELEPIPVIKYSDGKVVIATRHFMSNALNSSKLYKNQFPEILVDELYTHIVLSSVGEEELLNAGLMSSGFEPGKDDWEFTNYGSILSPGGNCMGHSLTAMWYYKTQKPKSNKQLYHLFDKFDKNKDKDDFWQDNPKGLKFVSVIQLEGDKHWVQLWNDFYNIVREQYTDSPDFLEAYTREGIKAAAAQMYAIREPMFTIVSTDVKGSRAHAVVGYAVDYQNGKIYVADPNHPGSKDRAIIFSNGKFQPYLSGSNANDQNSIAYHYFAFFGMSALFNWESISYRWAEVSSGNIGKGLFPRVIYSRIIDTLGLEEELTDDLVLNFLFDPKDPYIRIRCEIESSGLKINKPYISLFNDKGVEIARSSNDDLVINYPLDESQRNSQFGVWVWNLGNDGFPQWIDFKWVKITDLRIEPFKLYGEKNKEYTWKAVIENPPANARYVWNFGDSTPLVTVKNNPNAKHTYTKDGNFPIILQLYDDSNNQLFAVGSAYAVIGAGIIDTSYKIVLSEGYYDKDPTFEVKIKGTVSANELIFGGIRNQPGLNIPVTWYYIKLPTDLSIELNISINYISGKVSKSYDPRLYAGLYLEEAGYEVTKRYKISSFDFDFLAENVKIDTLGDFVRIKAFLPKTSSFTGISVPIHFIVKEKITKYYLNDDGSERKEEEYSDVEVPLIILGFSFKN